jgi:hypothetical protein
MIEFSQLTVLIVAEVILGLVILSGVLVYFTLARKWRIRKAAHHLAERVQNDRSARTERLKNLLSVKFGYAGEELEQTVRNITQAEMRLFQNLINSYMEDEQTNLGQIDVDEENLVLAYQDLKTPQGSAVASVLTDSGIDETEMQRLQEENKRLSDELRVTMDTMGRMLNEYSSMFSDDNDMPLTRPAAEKPTDEEQTDISPEEPETPAEESVTDIEIGEPPESEIGIEPETADPDALLDSESEAASALEEEVSEIIDEVMEIADEMNQAEKTEATAEAPPAAVGESLLDELEQVDIDLPEQGLAVESDTEAAEAEAESGSLEEEWAKLLEEDAENKQKKEDGY